MKARIAAVALSCSACAEDTGGHLVTFHAYAAGALGVSAPLTFDSQAGWHLTLQTARMHLGAMYMRLGQTDPGSANASCIGETTYGLQVPGACDVDLLSAQPQECSVLGDATSDLDQSAEIWLTGGDINVVTDPTVLVSITGTATRAGITQPFSAALTISNNRLAPPSNPALPGASPICKQRIVTPIPVQLTPTLGGNLLLRIDARSWFDDLDFSVLAVGADGSTLQIPDGSSDDAAQTAAGRSFFTRVTAASPAVYQFTWLSP